MAHGGPRLVLPTLLLLACVARAQTLLWSADGEAQDDRFGISVSGGNDLDGDGFADLVVGSWKHNGPGGLDAGKAYVYSGQTLTQIWALDGEAPSDECGYSVASAGDVNGDGNGDVVVGAPLHNGPGGIDSGKVYVCSGPTGLVLFALTGQAPGDRFGFSVSGAGDVNGDGKADLIVGANGFNGPAGLDTGKAYVYSGANASLLWSWTGAAAQDSFGASVSGAGDVNGDGSADLIVGAWRFDGPNGTNAGRAYVFSGANASTLFAFDGESANAAFGAAVSGAGDVDGDGKSDLLVGAWGQSTPAGSFAGRAYAYAGANGSLLFMIDGTGASDALGTSVAAAGDADGDGFADVAAGAPGENGTTGRVYVYRGGPTGGLLFEQGGEAIADFFGTGLGPGGDIDGDGFGEVAAGGHYHDLGGVPDVGKAYAYSAIPAGVASFGGGCPGSSGLAPRIGATGFPGTGSTLEVHVSRTLASTFAFLFLGASNTSAGGSPLPLNLAILGMPACNLLVSLDVLLPALTGGSGPSAGRATLLLPIPPDPTLIGGIVYLQWFVIDPGPLPLPSSMTRGLAVTIQ